MVTCQKHVTKNGKIDGIILLSKSVLFIAPTLHRRSRKKISDDKKWAEIGPFLLVQF